MSAAAIRVLGPVEVVGDDGPVSLAAKHRCLLAALLVAEGRSCSPDELVDALWESNPPASARKLVQVYVSQLRKSLPPSVRILTRHGSYALEVTPGLVDAERFERLLSESGAARREGNHALALSLLEQASRLWAGRAFGDLGYEGFLQPEVERLEELRLAALEERIDAQLALGRHAEVLGEILAGAAENPLRERLHGQAMVALYRCGRQAEALEAFTALRRRLDDELGLEPGPELRDLQRRILQHDPTLEVEDAADPSSPLPEAPNRLIGRTAELRSLAALLGSREARLLVLTGAGGSGKTRLALEAARAAAASYANGALLVELAPLHEPELVVPTIAQVVGVADARNPLDALAEALRSREVLLVLDNAEHVRDAMTVAVELVTRAPRVTILVTSRTVLHLSGEHVFPVAPLGEDDAVDLFVDRARLLVSSFERTPRNEADLREICRRLDGLPLAIELAAARMPALTPHALVERLGRRLALLTAGPRDLPARQQTLRETIEWSIDLVGERAREVLARTAVFPAGLSLEAAEVVCAADVDVLEELVGASLLRRTDSGDETRYGMLETIREYALELLAGERARVELALAEYFAGLADDLRRSASVEPERLRIVERLVPDVDNLRVAFAVAAESEDGELLLRLAGGLWRYWSMRGPVGEGLEWIERALTLADGAATVARAHTLQGGAGLAWMRGDLARATELAEAGIATAKEAGSPRDELAAHTVLGIVANDQGDRERARRHHRRSIELSERLGLEPLAEKLNLGVVALDLGDHAEAVALFEDVLASHRRNESPAGIGFALLNLGLAHYELADHRASRRDFEEARECLARAGLREQLAYAVQGLAAAEASEGRFEEAARLLGEARRELDEVGSPEDRFAPEMVATTKMRARSALGDAAFDDAYAAGVPSPR